MLDPNEKRVIRLMFILAGLGIIASLVLPFII